MNERCAITQATEFKRALIFFDRVFAPPAVANELPADIQKLTFYPDFGPPGEFLQQLAAAAQQEPKAFLAEFHSALIGSEEYAIESVVVPETFRALAKRIRQMGANVTPIYISEDRLAQEFPQGQHLAYQAVLESIPMLDGTQCDWKQILDLRQDETARRKLRDLHLWLEDSLEGKSISEAKLRIEQKIEDYTWALKKHGLKSITGALTIIYDWKVPAGALAAGTAATVFGGPVFGAIAAGFVVAGQVAVRVADRLIDREDTLRGPHREVALLHDLRKQFSNA